MNTSKEDVARFLKEAKTLIVKDEWLVVRRSVNLQDIADIGLDLTGVKNELLGLSSEDYSQGPEPDRDFPGEIWVFGQEILGNEVYIKLKIDQEDERLTCISFHIAKYELNYPFINDE